MIEFRPDKELTANRAGSIRSYLDNLATPATLSADCAWESADALESELPPNRGRVVAFPELGGLHHQYERLAA